MRGARVRQLFLVIFGSGLGGGARYLLGSWIAKALGPVFPYGTIAINTIGSFLISVVMYMAVTKNVIGSDLRLALTTGVVAGFTTYSTFNYDTMFLVQRGDPMLAALNVAATVIVCLLAGVLGLGLARAIIG